MGISVEQHGSRSSDPSILNLGILTAVGRFDELGIYVKGALRSGVTVAEIQDTLAHATVYCDTRLAVRRF